jgi:nucleoid-associated protein YgaU
MDPATVFLLFVVGVLCIRLLGTIVHPALVAVSRLGIHLRVGRQVAAVAVSFVLVGGMTSARATVGPPTERVVQMVNTTPEVDVGGTAIIHRPVLTANRDSYTVVKGDSLWRIARTILSDGDSHPSGSATSDLWHSIYEMNRELIGNDPNLIHPGQVLQLQQR